MDKNIYIYIGLMALVTYAIRVLPLTLIRKEIKNVYIRSFLYYVPYVTLSIMTFPAVYSRRGAGVFRLLSFYGFGAFLRHGIFTGIIYMLTIISERKY